ncbi:MAG: hypothetical protein V7731_21770 [Amphritea sp.]
MVIPSPDKLVEGNVSVLAKFGYQAFDGADEDWTGMWALLKGDFATAESSVVPDFDAMTPSKQEAAKIYMRRRLIADRFFEECRACQADLYKGIDTEQMERYTLARDAYEDSVNHFGEAREKLEQVLKGIFW